MMALEKSPSSLVEEEFKKEPEGDVDYSLPPVMYDEGETQAIMRRVDYHLMPVLSLLYLMSFLDRNNVANANVAGMQKDLHMNGTQYNIGLTIFFISYGVFEVPSNIALKFMRPSVWIPIIMLIWGTIMTLMGLLQNYQGFVVARMFLGMAEAGFFPAASYLLTCWYPRHEVQKRMGFFYAAGALSGAFSGLLAYAIVKMDGVGGLAGWRWIFILEGIVTVCFALVAPFVLPDDPSKARFLTKDEQAFMLHRLQADLGLHGMRSTYDDKFQMKYFWAAVKDLKIYLSVLVYWGNAMAIYGFIYTLPSTIKGLGYSASNAQLLTIPVYVAAVMSTLTAAYLSDKYKTRSIYIIYPLLLAGVGYIIIMAIPKGPYPGAIYGVLFIIAIGLYTTIPGAVSWNANNLSGSWKRAVGMAIQISIGSLGGAVGTNIFIQDQAPHYWLGYGISLGIVIMGAASAQILRIYLQRENRRRDAIPLEEIHATYTEAELEEMGDKSPLFRYTL